MHFTTKGVSAPIVGTTSLANLADIIGMFNPSGHRRKRISDVLTQ
jgi:hypothetical protein